jgi:hypothetical protein
MSWRKARRWRKLRYTRLITCSSLCRAAVKIHLGVEDDFRAAKKAHPALVVEGLAKIIALCQQGGYRATPDVPFAEFRRVHVEDPFGNRLELMERG